MKKNYPLFICFFLLTIQSFGQTTRRGGIIFYENNGHGLVADTTIPHWSTADLIVAKKTCENLVVNGFSDWHLTTKKELNQLYLNKNKVRPYMPSYYWSSTVVVSPDVMDNYEWWTQGMGSGTQIGYSATNSMNFRCVRAY